MGGNRPFRRGRTATVLVLTTTAIATAVAASAAAGEARPAAPTDLRATAYSEAVHLSWKPGADDPGLRYRMHNLTLGWTSDTRATTGARWGHGLQSGRTYTFEVTAVNADGVESAPSNRVTVTLPTMGPPRNVRAALDGDTVTVSWDRPAESEPGRLAMYSVRLDGALETRRLSSGESMKVDIPRVNPGTTHRYTVELGRAARSEPALVPVPPSQDTSPPSAPVVQIGFDEPCLSMIAEFVEESSDDVTPASEIRYEALQLDRHSGELFVNAYDMPRSGGIEEINPTAIRAVDEAGNRSAIEFPEFNWSC